MYIITVECQRLRDKVTNVPTTEIIKRKITNKMVLSYLISRFIIRPDDISPDFNVTAWNDANPDFYVPPHPLLYLLYLKPWYFMAVTVINALLPKPISHVAQIGVAALNLVMTPMAALDIMPTFIWKGIYLISYYAIKFFEWETLIDLLFRAHVIFSHHNVYYWMLNYLGFGILGAWPILRPDMFEDNHEYFCMYWSC